MPDKLKLICERLMLEIEFKKLDLKITREEFRAANNDFNSELQKYLEILSEADRNVVVAKMNNKIQALLIYAGIPTIFWVSMYLIFS